MSEYGKRVPLAFLLVGLLAALSRWHHGKWELFSDTIISTDSISDFGHQIDTVEDSDVLRAPVIESSGHHNDSGVPLTSLVKAPKTKTNDSIRLQIAWLNSLVHPFVHTSWFEQLPTVLQSWLRNFVFSVLVYFGLNFGWAYYIYECFGGDLFPKQNMPSWSDMREQMWVASWSLPCYSLLPALTEEIVERGWTLSYSSISDVGVPQYVALFVLYIAFVEFGVYWMHRGLHDFQPGYKYLHAVHHKYNKEHSMSPFAGLAFHPLDGILQALPYTLALFIVPMHFLTHELLLFATAFWTSNIHDNIHARLLPVMGAGWHTIHHTTYKHNYGHYFVIMDWLFDTLVSPEEFAAENERLRATRAAAAVNSKMATAPVLSAGGAN